MKKIRPGKIIRKMILTCTAAVLALSLCACTEIKLEASLSDDILVEAGEDTTSSAEGILRLMELINAYGEIDDNFFARSVGDITMDEYLKECVREELIMLTCISQIAINEAVYLTDEEIEAAYEEGRAAYEEIASAFDTASWGITEEDAESLYEKLALYEKLYCALTDSVTMQISETDTKVIEVNFVLFPEGTTIDEAESFRDEISAGADFEQACIQAGYEPYMNITVKKGDMVSAFENVAFALGDGELSECTETVDGIYLIECVEDYMEAESAANYNSVITSAKDEIFDEAYASYCETIEIRFNSDYWDKVTAADL